MWRNFQIQDDGGWFILDHCKVKAQDLGFENESVDHCYIWLNYPRRRVKEIHILTIVT